jgi:hypothetical protein
MARCPTCEYPLPENRERVGARCPSCLDPLYDPPGRVARPAREGEATCAVHPRNESIGPCGRCGNYLCEVCRTRWRDQVLCAACVERALGSNEATPEQVKSAFRQALTSLLLGVAAWVIAILSFVGLVVAAASAEPTAFVLLMCLAGLCSAAVPAVFSIGQAVAVLRARGNHMIMATIGLMLGGLYIGTIIGIFVHGVWQG